MAYNPNEPRDKDGKWTTGGGGGGGRKAKSTHKQIAAANVKAKGQGIAVIRSSDTRAGQPATTKTVVGLRKGERIKFTDEGSWGQRETRVGTVVAPAEKRGDSALVRKSSGDKVYVRGNSSRGFFNVHSAYAR